MIDLSKEQPLSLGAATAFVPRRRGRRVSAVTLWRWIVAGKGGVQLEALKTPAGWFTTLAAIERFYQALTQAEGRGALSRPPRPGPPTTPAWASALLDAAGIGTKK